MNKLYENLAKSKKEEDVAYYYRKELTKHFKNSIIKKEYYTDGILYIEDKQIKCLLEFKYDLDLKNRINVIKILIQCLYYLKDIQIKEGQLPNIIFVGDINESFVIGTTRLIRYLENDLDWSIPASNSYNENPLLLEELAKDIDINPFIFNMDRYSIKDIGNIIESISRNEKFQEEITINNLSREFDYFVSHIIKSKDLEPNQLSNLFIQLLIDPDDHYLHPKRKSMIATKNFGNIKVDSILFESFMDRIKEGSFKNKEELVATSDRLIEDNRRRRNGEFYTPTIWVDEAQRMITEELGENWKEEYVVWDPACGTCNLTRDYMFSNLFLSTLNQEDLDTANHMGFNPEATKFQFDFLNDDMEIHNPNSWESSIHKLPKELIDAFKQNKKIVIFMNPPFGNSITGLGQENKNGHSNTKLKSYTISNDIHMDLALTQIYPQFLVRLLLLKIKYKCTNMYISFFSPPIFLVSKSFSIFRNMFLDNFEFIDGTLFNSGEFSDTNNTWGIQFSVWHSI